MKLPALTTLVLSSTQDSDAGIESLVKLKTLKELALDRSGVTQAGLAKLRAALPGCSITPAAPSAEGKAEDK